MGILSAIARDTDAGFVTKGATSLVDLIRKQFGDDIDGATQELVRIGGFPESVARRIATGELPMDEASRVARREAQSMPETYYHGTNKGDIKEINMSPDWRTNDQSRGFWGSDNPRTSNTYADDFRRGTLYPFRVKKGQTESYNYEGNAWGNPPEGVIGAGANTNDIARKAFDRGVDAVEFRDIVDVATSVDGDQDLARKYLKDILRDRHGPDYQFNPMDATTEDYGKASTMARRELLGESNNVVVGNDSLIRSPNAAFDPQYTGPNIMGGAAGTAALAGLLAAPEEAEAGPMSRAAKIAALRAEANAARFGGDVDVSYRGDHVAPTAEYGAPLHNLTEMIPEDIYGPAGRRLYGIGDDAVDAEAFEVLNAVRGNPDAEVRMYRAVPSDAPDEIADGDWVTTSRAYAEMHGQNSLGGDYKVLEEPTFARRLQSEGYPYEFGYMKNGFADPRLLAGTALGTAGILGAIAAGDRDNTAMAASPRSDTLQGITMGLRDVERRLEGSPASLLFPEGVVNYLETVNRPYEDPTALTRAMALLDFL